MKHLPVLCIIPPYMLQKIIDNGSSEQREKAVTTAQISSSLRQFRAEAPAAPETFAKAGASAGLQRRVYNANNQSSLPGALVRSEGSPETSDPAADEAYDGAGATYQLYMNVYQRNSIDGAGMILDSTVHYGQGYDNAFWNGAQMVYGDGDEDLPASQRLFNRFTVAIDVIGHELTHGITQYTGNLNYANQSGALNESFSDVFGSLVKQYHLGQSAAEADWIIGAGLLTNNVQGVGIRSMKAPGSAYDDPVLGKDPQPGHMNQYVNTTSDNGGVHINSGIPNRAFYLAAMALGGNAWEKAGLIWYQTLVTRIQPTSDFQSAAGQTVAVAGDLYGQNSPEQQAIVSAWAGVGITVDQPAPSDPGQTPGESQDPAQNPGCLQAFLKMLGV